MKTLRFVIKILEFILIILCLAGLTWGIYYLLTFHSLPKTPFKSQNNVVVIVATAPFQLLVTYPNGQKTGFDPVSGKEVFEIPGSKYYFKSEEPVPEPGSSGEQIRCAVPNDEPSPDPQRYRNTAKSLKP